MTRSSRCSWMVAFLVSCGCAQAQFVGDVFARVPSVAAPSGGQATVEVQLFSGANVFGASIIELSFQPTQLALREVVLQGAAGQRRIAVDRRSSGKVEIATFSVDGSANPIGTVTLAQVVFDVLATPGTVARYRMTPREAITQSETRYARLRGADGEVVAVSAGTQAAALRSTSAEPLLVSDPDSLNRAAALRPRGGQVDLVMPIVVGASVVPQVVRTKPASTRGSE